MHVIAAVQGSFFAETTMYSLKASLIESRVSLEVLERHTTPEIDMGCQNLARFHLSSLACRGRPATARRSVEQQ